MGTKFVYAVGVQNDNAKKKPKFRRDLFSRTISLVLPHTFLFTVALIALGAASGINLLFPHIIKFLLDTGGLDYFKQHYIQIGLGLVLLFGLQGLCFYVRAFAFGVIGQRVVANLRRALFSALIQKPVTYFDSAKATDLVSRITNDVQLLQDTVSIKLSVLIRYALQVVVGVVLMATLSWPLTLTIMLLLPVLVGLSIALGKKLRSLTRAQQELLSQASARVQEAFDGIRLVKAFNREEYEISSLGRLTAAWSSVGEDRWKVSAFFQSFVSFLLNTVIILVLLFGIYLVSSNRLTSGELTAFLLYGAIVAVSFSFVASSYTELVTSLGASERIFEVLDSHTPQPSASKTPITQLGNIQFNQVHFAYPSRPENVVLQGLQFEIPKAKVTALVGQSGSGKSTIVQLLMQLYSPTKGHISFDGQEAASFSSQSIRDRIALVPQDQILFSTSIKENLLYAKIDASQIELEQACAQAQILDFIRSLTLGFDTLVGERGVQLSTGQRQRLAIARAILKSPELLILDEATSALDVENEFLIQKAIEPLLKRCTVLVIAHRLSTIRSAQQVIVLESGKVVEIGSHDELMKGSGLYRNLVERQSERKVDCA